MALARSLWETGRRQRAVTLAEEALDELRGVGKAGAEEVAEIEAWLAQNDARRRAT